MSEIQDRIKFLQTMDKDFLVAGTNKETGNPADRMLVKEIKNYENVFHREQLSNEIIMEVDGKTTEISKEFWYNEINPVLVKNNFHFELWNTQSKSVQGSLFFTKPISNAERKAFIEYYFKKPSKKTWVNDKGETKEYLDSAYWKDNKHLIALEHQTHWKSGKPKIYIGDIGEEGELNKFPDIPIPKKTATKKTSDSATQKTHKQILKESSPKEKERLACIRKITKIYPDWDAETIADYVAEHNNWINYDPPKTLDKIKEVLNRYVDTTKNTETTELIEPKKTTYNQVVNAYKKHYYINPETVQAIDLIYSITLLTKTKTKSIWLILVGSSGDKKTTLIKPLMKIPIVKVLSKITPNTFLSGTVNKPDGIQDLAYRLKNNPTLILTPDFAQFLKLKSDMKNEIWSQLRDLYDGFAQRDASKVTKFVDGIKTNWLICSTPAIDSELLIHSELGTRELLFRFNKEEKNLEEEQKAEQTLMNTVWDNTEEGREEEILTEISLIASNFISYKNSLPSKEIIISNETKTKIMQIAQTITKLRASAECDLWTGDLTNFVYEEKTTRILQQLKVVFAGLKQLDENYSDERALKVLDKIALSSIHPTRLKIILEIMKDSELSTTQIQKRLGLGWKTVKNQLWTAWHLKIIKFRETEEQEGKEGQKKFWYVNSDSIVVRYLQEIQELEEVWDGFKKSYREGEK